MTALLKLSRPLHLLLAALTYFLGAGIANYLGKPFVPVSFWLGLAGIVLAQASMGLLAEVFRPANEPIVENETRKERLLLRNNALFVSIAFLSVMAVVAYILINNDHLSLSSFLFFLLFVFIILAYAIPPFRLLNRGFGEFLLAAQIAYIVPSIGFLLQSDEYHRLLPALSVPLTTLALAYFLVLDFPSYAGDQKYQRLTMLRLLSWERAVPLHHSLIVAAYALFFAATFLGISFRTLWPIYLSLPFAVFQIIQLRAIALGNRPNWKLLSTNALAVFGLTAYFLTLTFWLR
jgi:1,4-dihydroxy-2-naphthoate octaprenyltransferase